MWNFRNSRIFRIFKDFKGFRGREVRQRVQGRCGFTFPKYGLISSHLDPFRIIFDMFNSLFINCGAFYASFGLQDPSGSLRSGTFLRMGGLGSQIGGLRPHLDPSEVSVESGPRLSSFESGPRLPSEKSGQVAAAAGALAPAGAPASGSMAGSAAKPRCCHG